MKFIKCLMVLFFVTSCSDPHWHNEEAVFLTDEVDKILISKGVCNTANECNNQEYVFFRTSETSITVNVYKIEAKDVQLSICEKLKVESENKKYSVKVYVNFYGLSHGSDGNSIVFKCVTNQ